MTRWAYSDAAMTASCSISFMLTQLASSNHRTRCPTFHTYTIYLLQHFTTLQADSTVAQANDGSSDQSLANSDSTTALSSASALPRNFSSCGGSSSRTCSGLAMSPSFSLSSRAATAIKYRRWPAGVEQLDSEEKKKNNPAVLCFSTGRVVSKPDSADRLSETDSCCGMLA